MIPDFLMHCFLIEKFQFIVQNTNTERNELQN